MIFSSLGFVVMCLGVIWSGALSLLSLVQKPVVDKGECLGGCRKTYDSKIACPQDGGVCWLKENERITSPNYVRKKPQTAQLG